MRCYDMSTLFIDFVIHINIASIFSRYDFIHLFLKRRKNTDVQVR